MSSLIGLLANAFIKIHIYLYIVKQKARGFPQALLLLKPSNDYSPQDCVATRRHTYSVGAEQNAEIADEESFDNYIMPPMPGLAGAAGSGAGISAIAHSLVRMSAAMLAAF